MSRAPDPASAGDDAGHGASRDQRRDQAGAGTSQARGGERFAAGMPLAAAAAGPGLAAPEVPGPGPG